MTTGLNDKEVEESRRKFGTNEITKKKKNTFISILLESLGDPIIKILLIALAVKVVFLVHSSDIFEVIGILVAIFLASFISSISEYGSNKAFERLQEENKLLKSKVYRNNKLTEIYVKDIVVGDIIKITTGDKIPADGQIIKGNLTLDESFMTGESKEVYKKSNDKVYSGSVVYKGDCLIKVTEIGDKTFMGDISSQMQEKDEESPLKQRLHVLAMQISKLGYLGAFLATASYLFIKIFVENHFVWADIMATVTNFHTMLGFIVYALTLCVTIIIMAVPEGLPMMITLVLSSNMKRMLKDNVLVRKLVGIETSGTMNYLFCDKTGTLTEGNLKVETLITKDDKQIKKYSDLESYPKYRDILNNSLILNNECDIEDNNIIGGNATDKAIINFMQKGHATQKVVTKKDFDSAVKYSFVKSNTNDIYYKGAAEILLAKCDRYLSLTGEKKILLNKEYLTVLINKYTSSGYRVLLNAFSDNGKDTNLIFISLIVISDTIREEAYESVKTIQNAGIKIVMITGDNKNTALAIAKKLNIMAPNDLIFTHEELAKLSDEDISKNTNKIAIIARALPQDKARLVSIYKDKGLVVGMTGDGVNDALALKKSDIGFSLGSGSEVAKEASDIVILDDNISSICKAILYGRTIFKSIRKFVTYQLTVNICALILSILGTLIGVATPITIIQMLWLNMIMDTFAGLAFSYEAPLKEYMEEKPKQKDEKIINKYMINQVAVNGLYTSIICLLFLKLPIISSFFSSEKHFMTAFFALFIFFGIINSFLARTHRINLLAHLKKNPVFIFINVFIITVQMIIIYYGGDLFRTYGLSLKELVLIGVIALTIIPVDFIRKEYLKKQKIPLGM